MSDQEYLLICRPAILEASTGIEKRLSEKFLPKIVEAVHESNSLTIDNIFNSLEEKTRLLDEIGKSFVGNFILYRAKDRIAKLKLIVPQSKKEEDDGREAEK